MKMNSTTICFILIVLIVGYLVYINRNVIMGTTSKFGAPGNITVYVYNLLVDAPLTISSTGRDYKAEYLYPAGKDLTWFRPLTINNSYPLIIKTTYNSSRAGEAPKPMDLKLENLINYPFMNDDFILVSFEKKTGRYICDIFRYGNFLRRQYLVNFY